MPNFPVMPEVFISSDAGVDISATNPIFQPVVKGTGRTVNSCRSAAALQAYGPVGWARWSTGVMVIFANALQ